jgi:rhodanese-related sulfurtransferase
VSRVHLVLAISAAALGCTAAVSDLQPALNAKDLAAEIDSERDHISALDLAERIVHGDKTLSIFDLRSTAEFERFHIPSARRASIQELAQYPVQRDTTVVLYSEGGSHAAQAWVLLRVRGHRNVLFLREGIYEWISRVFEPRLAIDASAREKAEFEHAAELSRFFGGVPLAGVPRSEGSTGYWTSGGRDGGRTAGATERTIPDIRRRGC